MIKLLAIGYLHKFELGDFYHLIGLLFSRVEYIEGNDKSLYYIPEFPRHPDLMKKVIKASEMYGLDVDFTKPIHRYFFDFCRKQIVYPELLQELEDMGEWLYTFRLGVRAVCPMEGRGKYAKPTDKFAKLLFLADDEYLAARTSQSV